MSEPQHLSHGRYLLVQRLGEGGMATVYRAFDQRLQVWRAIKVLLPEYAKKKKILQRFDAEAQTMALLEHPNIVRVYDVGVEDAHAYIVMELVEGGSLVDWLETNGPMPPRMAADVVVEVCQALHFAHQKGVIHRDIKPHNIMIDRDGVCRLTDFGIARAGDSDEQLTKTGAVMGTWGFMAPEQRTDAKHVDARADIYAMAASLYSLITDRTPMDLFAAEQDATMLEGVPEGLVPVLVRATEYKKERRYATAQELAAALLSVRDSLPDTPAGTPALKREVAPLPPPPKTRSDTNPDRSGARPAPMPVGPGGGETILPLDAERSGSQLAGNLTMPPMVDGTELPAPSRPVFDPSAAPDGGEDRKQKAGGLPWAALAAVVALLGAGVGGWFAFQSEPEPAPVVVVPEAPTPGVAPGAVAPAPTGAAAITQPVVAPPPGAEGAPGSAPVRPRPSPGSAPPRPGAPAPAPVAAVQPAVENPPPQQPPPQQAPPEPPPAAPQCFDKVQVPTSVATGETVAFSAKTCKPGPVTLHYRPAGSGSWFTKNLPMVLGTYKGSIPVDEGYASGVEWYLSSDGATHGSAGSPKKVKVNAAAGGSAEP